MLVIRSLVPFVLLCTSGATAQNLLGLRDASVSQGITTIGRATVGAAPDRARVSVQVFGSVGTPVAGGVPLDDAANALVDAFKSNGVSDAHEVLPFGNINARNVVPAVFGTVAKPTRERLEAIARAIVKAVPDRFVPAFANAQVQVAFIVDDCAPAEARAERAAFADAKARAERLADAAGVELGSVAAIADTQTFLPPGCTTKPDSVENAQANVVFGTNAYAALELPVTANVTVTFRIANR
jgi:uncharacterized protein YggE